MTFNHEDQKLTTRRIIHATLTTAIAGAFVPTIILAFGIFLMMSSPSWDGGANLGLFFYVIAWAFLLIVFLVFFPVSGWILSITHSRSGWRFLLQNITGIILFACLITGSLSLVLGIALGWACVVFLSGFASILSSPFALVWLPLAFDEQSSNGFKLMARLMSSLDVYRRYFIHPTPNQGAPNSQKHDAMRSSE